MKRVFLHVDMDAFFASVEQYDHPEYRGKPVVVGAPRDKRGVVSAASYEAREFGIHSAMPSREAARRCPHAIFVPVNGARYQEVSRQILHIFESFTPLVEPLSIDEAFLDVTGALRIFGDGPEMARKIKERIVTDTGLTASVGVAPNKFLAKIASDLDKPDGLTVVPASREGIDRFLAPLPVRAIWGVGKVTQSALEEVGIRTVGELQACPEKRLAGLIGRHSAQHLLRLAHGQDDREIQLEHEEKSISKEHTFGEDCADREVLRRVLLDLVDDVGGRLRAAGRAASVVRLKLRWKSFKTISRQRTLSQPCHDDFSLRAIAEELFAAEDLEEAVRLIGFGVSVLVDPQPSQLSLFDDDPERSKREALSQTVDTIRAKLGPDSIGRGAAQGDSRP